MDLEKIGKFIMFLRKEKKLTQAQLAEIFNVSDKSVSKWERGICLPESTTVEKIINFFNIPLEDFYAGERKKNLINDKTINMKGNSEELLKKKKTKKFFYSIIILFVTIIVLILFLFMYNKYNKYNSYNISPLNEKFQGNGNIIIEDKKSSITLMDISILDNEFSTEEIYDLEYSLMLEDTLIYHSGDIYSFEKNNESSKEQIEKYINNISIYINYDLSELVQQDELETKKIFLIINYINSELEIKDYVMEFKISKSTSNNKVTM